MSKGRGPQPAEPEEEGVAQKEPPSMQIEPARLLANDAREALRRKGFDDHQIDAWAETYIADFGDGEVDDFMAWITEQEDAQP